MIDPLWQWFQAQPSNNQLTILLVVVVVTLFAVWQIISFLRNIFDSIFNRNDDRTFLRDLIEGINEEGEETREVLEKLVHRLENVQGSIDDVAKAIMTAYQWYREREDNKDRDLLQQVLHSLPGAIRQGVDREENYPKSGEIRKA